MRIIAKSTLTAFSDKHPEAKVSLIRWHRQAKAAKWASIPDVLGAFGSAKMIDSERVRFEVHGGNYRLIVAFDFEKQIAFVKFVGTHAEYDAVDARKVSKF